MRNSRATGRDMLISLAVILIPCAAIYWLFAQIPDQPSVPVADWKPVVAQAKKEASYQVLAPTALPDTWKPVRALWRGQELQLGYLGPEQVYYSVKERAGAENRELVKEVSRDGRVDGTTTLAGRTWQRTVSPDERTRCLVNTEKGTRAATRVVCGDTSYEGVAAFASTLA